MSWKQDIKNINESNKRKRVDNSLQTLRLWEREFGTWATAVLDHQQYRLDGPGVPDHPHLVKMERIDAEHGEGDADNLVCAIARSFRDMEKLLQQAKFLTGPAPREEEEELNWNTNLSPLIYFKEAGVVCHIKISEWDELPVVFIDRSTGGVGIYNNQVVWKHEYSMICSPYDNLGFQYPDDIDTFVHMQLQEFNGMVQSQYKAATEQHSELDVDL